MRLNEILIEQQLDERPMGVLGKMAAKAQKLVPGRAGRRAQGKLEIGNLANKLSDEFDVHLGKVDRGEGATPEIVLGFLKKKGYPTKGAEAAMKEPTMAQKAGDVAGKAVGKIKDTAANIKSGIKTGMDNVKEKPTTTDKNPPEGGTPQPIPSQTDDNNISMAGVKANKQQPIKKVANSSFENNADSIMEGFTGAQLDKIFMAAAKDYVDQNEGGQNQAGTGTVDQPAQGGAGGFMSSFKQAYNQSKGTPNQNTGTDIPKDIMSKIEPLDGQQKKQLLGMIK